VTFIFTLIYTLPLYTLYPYIHFTLIYTLPLYTLYLYIHSTLIYTLPLYTLYPYIHSTLIYTLPLYTLHPYIHFTLIYTLHDVAKGRVVRLFISRSFFPPILLQKTASLVSPKAHYCLLFTRAFFSGILIQEQRHLQLVFCSTLLQGDQTPAT